MMNEEVNYQIDFNDRNLLQSFSDQIVLVQTERHEQGSSEVLSRLDDFSSRGRRDVQLKLERVEKHLRVKRVDQESLCGCGGEISTRRRKLKSWDSNFRLKSSRRKISPSRSRQSDRFAAGGIVAILNQSEITYKKKYVKTALLHNLDTDRLQQK